MVEINLIKKCIQQLKFNFPYSAEDWINTFQIENYHSHKTWSNVIQADSATSTEEFCKMNYDRGCKCLFSTEHGYAGNYFLTYDLCHDEKALAKIEVNDKPKFRYGAEFYWVKDRHETDNANCHIVIIARNYTGMRKLNYLTSIANTELENGGGFYGKPRIDLELIKTLTSEDVFITSACIGAWKYVDVEDIWIDLHNHFKDSFFLEYQCNNTPEQKSVNKRIQQLSKQYNIQTIIGLDTHYISEKDKIRRDDLLKRKKISYPEEFGWYMDFPTGKEVYKRMVEQEICSEEEIIVSMMNTNIFVNECEEITFNTDFKIPILPSMQHMTSEERKDILRRLMYDRYEKIEINKSKEREEAIEYELGEINGSEIQDYFLLNYAIVKNAIEKFGGELTPTSRGSASSYYTSKLCGFTTMDRFESEVPIFPERFITKDRVLSSHQCADIDYNVSSQKPFVQSGKYLIGDYSVAPLIAFGKIGEKSGWQLYASLNDVPPETANQISKFLDEYNEALKHASDDEKGDIHIEDYIPQEYVEIFEKSKDYRGIVENGRIHACGHILFNGDGKNKDIVGYGDVRYEFGLIRCHSKSTGRIELVANVEGGYLDKYGYVKDDFLIVDSVAIMYKLYKAIGMPLPTVNELRKMVDGDKKVWDLYANGITCCLNQCEKQSTTNKVMKFKPQNPQELAMFIAGIRPGFASLLNTFLNREPYSCGEKAIDEILKDSYHFMLFQESIMRIFNFLGIPMQESYDTIKGISKKKLKGEKLKQVEDSMKCHWLDNIGNIDNFDKVYNVVKDSSRYSFNAPHAGSMAFDSLYEAWGKAHYPSIFYEVTLNHYQEKGDKKKVNALLLEAIEKMGYSLGTYEYGADNSKFTVDDETKIIYPSLSSIKGIGSQVCLDLLNVANMNLSCFKDIYLESLKIPSITKTTFRKLIKIGYFHEFGSIEDLLSFVDIYDDFCGKKQLSKEKLIEKGIDINSLLSFGRQTEKKLMIEDEIGLVDTICKNIPHIEDTIYQRIKYQFEVLEFSDITDTSLPKSICYVSNLERNSYGSVFVTLYCIKNGKSATLRADKRFYDRQEEPLEVGNVINIEVNKKERKKKNPNPTGKHDMWLPTGEYYTELSSWSYVILD